MGDVGVVWRDGHAMDAHESTPLARRDAVAAHEQRMDSDLNTVYSRVPELY